MLDKHDSFCTLDICPFDRCADHAFEAWERQKYGGVQIEYYSKAEYDQWAADAEAYLASCGF